MAVQNGTRGRGSAPYVDMKGFFKVTKTQQCIVSGDTTSENIAMKIIFIFADRCPLILHTVPATDGFYYA